MDDIAERLADRQPNRIDGVRIETEDGWGMVRASVTQPIFTLRFEGKTDAFIEEMKELFLSAMDDTLAARVREAFSASKK